MTAEDAATRPVRRTRRIRWTAVTAVFILVLVTAVFILALVCAVVAIQDAHPDNRQTQAAIDAWLSAHPGPGSPGQN